jgi:hypothetical protein
MHYDLAENEHGLTMRDYFAAKAMQGLFNDVDLTFMNKKQMAEWAYKMADEMMEARDAAQ